MDYSNTSGVKSPFSPRMRPSLASRRSLGISPFKRSQNKFNTSARLNQTGEVINKTSLNTVENYGLPLPVLVTETLTFADPNAQVTAKFSPSGWCWLVCGRKLLIWQYRENRGGALRNLNTATCRELTLPQTDLAHKANLASVFITEGNQMPSCIGVSPEGIVRYWPSIVHEGSYIDESADLQGQECDSLTDVTPVGCVLATTTCTIVLVQPNIIGGRQTVQCRTLRPPSGWLGGLGRRVSLLIFGSMPSAQMVETKLVGVTVLDQLILPSEDNQEPYGPYITCMAAGPCLQLWRLAATQGGAERLLHEVELRRPLREAFLQAQMFPQGDTGSLDVFVLDMQASANGLLLLIAGVNLPRSAELRYALAHISVEENPHTRVTSFVPLQRTTMYREDPNSDVFQLKFLATSSTAYLYNQKQVMAVSSTIANDKPDVIEFSNNRDRILGGTICSGLPIFFSKNHGVVSVIPNDYAPNDISVCESPTGSPCPTDAYDGNLSLYEIDPNEIGLVSHDACSKLKTAFLYHVRRDVAACRATVESAFPAPRLSSRAAVSSDSEDGEGLGGDVDAPLDRVVVRIAREMLDDGPAGDPRWNHSMAGTVSNISLGSSSALQISAQLQDKQRAMALFVSFLRATGLWQRLGIVSREGANGVIPTVAVLGELTEKLAAALALRRFQQDSHANIVDTAIQKVITSADLDASQESAVTSGSLSPSDLFYCRVTHVERALLAVALWCSDEAASYFAQESVAKLLLGANQVLLGVMQEVHKTRGQRADLYGSAGPVVTWTGNLSPGGLLTALAKQQNLTIEHGARPSGEVTLKAQLYDQAVALAELVLTEARAGERASRDLAAADLFHTLKGDMIKPFVDDGQYNRASILSEKFLDFDMLVLICHKSNDMDKLHTYMDKYANDGFIELTFAWFADQVSPAALLRSFPQYASRLSAWLSRASGERAHLRWVHEARGGRWRDTAECLLGMAGEEELCVGRMVTMSSIAKLALHAAEDAPDESDLLLQRAEQCLELGQYHAELPRSLLLSHGLLEDVENGTLRVMTPAEIVDMYVTSTSQSLTEIDFKRALDITQYLNEEDREILIRKVWCAAILQDDWSHYRADAPLLDVQSKVFFKLAEHFNVLEVDLENIMPGMEDILECHELDKLQNEVGFQFLLKYGYENIYRRRMENSAMQTS